MMASNSSEELPQEEHEEEVESRAPAVELLAVAGLRGLGSRGRRRQEEDEEGEDDIDPAVVPYDLSAPIIDESRAISNRRAARREEKGEEENGTKVEKGRGPVETSAPAKAMGLNEQEALVFSFLDLHHDFYIADIRADSPEEAQKVPVGLEVFSTMTRLKVTKREVIPDDDLDYRAYCQYDICDETRGMNIAVALEKTNPWAVTCMRDSRLFDIQVYDYVCERILHIRRRFTWPFCLDRFTCLSVFLGSNGCGNVIQVSDFRDRPLGYIRQCPFWTKRLIYLSEANATVIGSHNYSWRYFFRHLCQAWMNLRIKKFDVIDSEGRRRIRIEQYIRDGNMFKFIVLDQLFNAGYVRKCAENEYVITLWKHFDERDKALLFASSFLFDHIKFHVSLRGTYMKVHEMKHGHRVSSSSNHSGGRTSTTNSTHNSVTHHVNNNLLRLVLYLILVLVLLVIIIIPVTFLT